MSAKGTILFCAFALLHIFFSLLFFGLAFSHLHIPGSASEGSTQSIKNIITNQLVSPITDLRFESVCASSEKSLSLYQWKGVRTGCVCEDGDFRIRPKKNYKKDCSFILDKSGIRCEFVEKIEKDSWELWEGKKFCVKNYENEQYSFLNDNAKCPSDQRLCCKNVCVRNDLSCPITNLSAGSDADLEKIQIGSSIFKIIREADESPLVDLHTSLNGFQCMDTNLIPTIKSYPATPGTSGCSELGDISGWAKLLKTQDQLNFYRENKKELVDLPLFINFINPQEKAGIYTVSRILPKNSGVCSQYDNEIIASLNESEGLMDHLYNIAIAVFIMGAVCLCSVVGKHGRRKSDKKSSTEIMILVFFLSAIGMTICGFIYSGMYFSSQSDTFSDGATKYEVINQIIDTNCYQNYPGINKVFENLISVQDSGENMIRKTAIALIVWNIIFVLAVIGTIFWLKSSSSEGLWEQFNLD